MIIGTIMAVFMLVVARHYNPVEFTFRKQKFNCAEQAYQHSKATMFGDERVAAAILQATNPANQKYLAMNIRGFKANTWNNAKVILMKDIIHNKFSQHHQLAEQLCDTGDLHLGEASLRDTFYGTGLSLDHKYTTNKNKWQSNKLGRLLMAERTALVAAKNS